MKELKVKLVKKYPNVEKCNKCLFEDYLHHMLVMEQVCNKLEIPIEELMDFFYKGKIKTDLIEREEYRYKCQKN